MRTFETNSNDHTKGLTELLIEKMTANTQSVRAVGVFGALLCYLRGSGSQIGVFYGFFWGWGRAVVLLRMTQPPQSWMELRKVVSSTAIPFSAPARSRVQHAVVGACVGAWCGLAPWLPAAPLCAPLQERSRPSVPPAAGRARGLCRDLTAASCPTFKGTQSQTAGCSRILRAGTASLLVFALQLVDWPFKKTVSAAVKHRQ